MEFKPNTTYHAKHKPSGEDWHIIGIDPELDQVCAAGWPPTMANLSDCYDFEEHGPITPEEFRYRKEQFGNGSPWL